MNKKTTMTEIRTIITKLKDGQSLSAISEALSLSRTAIRVYRDRSIDSGKSFEELLALSDAELSSILTRPNGHKQGDKSKAEELEPLIPKYIKALHQRHATYLVVYERYKQEVANHYQYTQFKEKLHDYEKSHATAMHIVRIPGEEMQVDFAGDTYWIEDKKTGIKQKVYVLVCNFPVSQVCFFWGMLNTTMEQFLYGLSRCLEYFGGAPKTVMSDNMKQYVKRYDRHEPTFTEAAMQWSLFYNTELLNTRIRSPRDKGSVESGVNQMYNYVLARLETGGPDCTPMIFNTLDSFNNMMLMMSEKVKVTWDMENVEVWLDLQRIAIHRRTDGYGYTTLDEHMPPNDLAYKRCREHNARYFIDHAYLIGPETTAVIEAVLRKSQFVYQNYRSCEAILGLTHKYSTERLEKACSMIKYKSTACYTVIKNILEKNLDKQSEQQDPYASYMPDNDDVRGPESYS
jgi:transposase